MLSLRAMSHLNNRYIQTNPQIASMEILDTEKKKGERRKNKKATLRECATAATLKLLFVRSSRLLVRVIDQLGCGRAPLPSAGFSAMSLGFNEGKRVPVPGGKSALADRRGAYL